MEVKKWIWLLVSFLHDGKGAVQSVLAHLPLNSARFKSLILHTLILTCCLCHCFDYSVASEKQILCIWNKF